MKPWRVGIVLVLLSGSAHADLRSETVFATPDGISVSVTVSGGQGAQGVVLPMPEGVTSVSDVDPAALNDALATSSPRLQAEFDDDPCFPRGNIPPPPPALALDALPGTPIPVEFRLFSSEQNGLAAWMRQSGVTAWRSTPGPLLALIVPANSTSRPLYLRLRSSSPTLPIAAPATTVMTEFPTPMKPQGLAVSSAPTDSVVPEFVYSQFTHVFDDILRHEGAPAARVYAGPQQGSILTRFELRDAPVGVATFVTDSNQPPFRSDFTTRIGWKGQYTLACSAGFDYRHALTKRWQQENASLAALTGWQRNDIRRAMVESWLHSVASQQHANDGSRP